LTWRRPSASSQHNPPALPLLVLGGPTASGKTRLAVQLAHRFDGEIIGADARQVYRGLDIGTGKATPAELEGVPHHLLDVVAPDDPFTVTQYAELATAAIAAVHRSGKLPILTGGSGLYLRAVVDGLVPPEVPPQPELRAELERRWDDDREGLLRELAVRDPVAGGRIDRRNPRRVIRAMEVILVTGRPFSEQQRLRTPPYQLCMLALTGERAALHRLADRRVEAMLAGGLLEEVGGLLAAGYDFHLPAFSAVGYREVAAYLGGDGSLAAVGQRMREATHAYQRRQLTWFRADARYHWLATTEPGLVSMAQRLVEAWLEGEQERFLSFQARSSSSRRGGGQGERSPGVDSAPGAM
jgi:tRNA dimethylallyltransferase